MSTIYDDCSKEELLQIVSEMQTDLNNCKNDYKQASNEIALLNRQLDRKINDVNNLTEMVKTQHDTIRILTEQNNELKFRLKMLTKVALNSIYGISHGSNIGTLSIKETSDNDSNN